jgi:hypothetical protein
MWPMMTYPSKDSTVCTKTPETTNKSNQTTPCIFAEVQDPPQSGGGGCSFLGSPTIPITHKACNMGFWGGPRENGGEDSGVSLSFGRGSTRPLGLVPPQGYS